MVYCDAPTTVARIPSTGASTGTPHCAVRASTRPREERTEVAEVFRLPAVDVLGHAARKRERFGSPRLAQRRQPQKARGFAACDATPHGFEQAVGHALRDPPALILGEAAAEGNLHSSLGGEPAAGLLDPRHPTGLVEADDARADVGRGQVDDLAALADGDLRRAAPDVDVHHPPAVADRTGHRAGAEGGQRRLEPIAGAHRHELAGLLREELADRAGVPAPNRDAGEDERPGVDGVGILPCSPY